MQPATISAICFDWGGTLMSEDGPADIPMALWPHVRPIDGAADCLASLAGRFPLCIATNAAASDVAMIQRALGRVNFAHYFSRIFCYTDLGYRKDQPEFWQAVSAELRLPLDEIAMIGDSLGLDCLAPRSFGVQAVWFNERDRHPQPAVAVPTVTDLRDFARMLQNRFGGLPPSEAD